MWSCHLKEDEIDYFSWNITFTPIDLTETVRLLKCRSVEIADWQIPPWTWHKIRHSLILYDSHDTWASPQYYLNYACMVRIISIIDIRKHLTLFCCAIWIILLLLYVVCPVWHCIFLSFWFYHSLEYSPGLFYPLLNIFKSNIALALGLLVVCC